MKFRPLHDRVVVKRIDAEDKTAGGIIIPDTAKEKPSQGEVVAVGRIPSKGFVMKFRPLHDRVVLRRITAEEKSTGGIIIPDTAKEKPMEGEVVAVGPGARNEQGQIIAPDVKAGDRVLFGKWSGTEVKIDGEELLIMKESDIMGVIEGTSADLKKAA